MYKPRGDVLLLLRRPNSEALPTGTPKRRTMHTTQLTVRATASGPYEIDIEVTTTLFPNGTATMEWGDLHTFFWESSDFIDLLDAMDQALWQVEMDRTFCVEWQESFPHGAIENVLTVDMAHCFPEFLAWARPRVPALDMRSDIDRWD